MQNNKTKTYSDYIFHLINRKCQILTKEQTKVDLMKVALAAMNYWSQNLWTHLSGKIKDRAIVLPGMLAVTFAVTMNISRLIGFCGFII